MSPSLKRSLCGLVSSLIVATTSACSESPNPSCLDRDFAVPLNASFETAYFEEIYREGSFIRVYYHDREKIIRERRYFYSGNGEEVYSKVPRPLLNQDDHFVALDRPTESAVVVVDDLEENEQGYARVLSYTVEECFVQKFAEKDRLISLTYVEIHIPRGQQLSSGSYQGKSRKFKDHTNRL